MMSALFTFKNFNKTLCQNIKQLLMSLSFQSDFFLQTLSLYLSHGKRTSNIWN